VHQARVITAIGRPRLHVKTTMKSYRCSGRGSGGKFMRHLFPCGFLLIITANGLAGYPEAIVKSELGDSGITGPSSPRTLWSVAGNATSRRCTAGRKPYPSHSSVDQRPRRLSSCAPSETRGLSFVNARRLLRTDQPFFRRLSDLPTL